MSVSINKCAQHSASLILLLAFIGFVVGCTHQEENDAVNPTTGLSQLEQAYYLRESNSALPLWLQNEIAEYPYLLVYRSSVKQHSYLVEYPETGQYKQYSDGRLKSVKSEDLDKVIVAGQPWTCTHIYSFPLYPGDEEWDLNKYTPNQIKERLLLPKHLLKTMRTSDLTEVCLDYPYMTDFLAYDEWQNGFDYLCKEFNGYNELLQRADFVQTILKKMNTHWQKIEKVRSLTSLEKGEYGLQCALFTMILAQDRALNQFDDSHLRQMLDLSFTNFNIEQAEPEIFGTSYRIIRLYLYAKIIQRQGGFVFKSEQERQHFELFASTCTIDTNVLAIFTEDLQQRMVSYLTSK